MLPSCFFMDWSAGAVYCKALCCGNVLLLCVEVELIVHEGFHASSVK